MFVVVVLLWLHQAWMPIHSCGYAGALVEFDNPPT